MFVGKASLKTAVPYHRASRFCQSSGSASGPPATAIPSLHTTSLQVWVLWLRRQTHLPLTPCFWRWAEETVEDGDVAAEERCFLLHYVLLQEGGDLVTKQSLVVLPDLPFHFHSTHFIQFLVGHHNLQLFLGHLQQEAQLKMYLMQGKMGKDDDVVINR